MKNAFKRLQGRVRHAWRLSQARFAIARCNRHLAQRGRIGEPAPARKVREYAFAPGVIDKPAASARNHPSFVYAVTMCVAVVSVIVLFVWGIVA